jgi:hypothetical protein
MADDKTKHDKRDTSRVAAGQDYEVDYFAKRHGLTKQQALDLIKRHGNNRAALDRAAQDMGRKGGGADT